MDIERVEYSPQREVYNPGDVLDVAVHFRRAFVGQCEAGLVRGIGEPPADFRRYVFARSSDVLYEGQVHVREDLVGTCLLWVKLTPVKGDPELFPASRNVLEVRPIRP